MSKVLRPLVDDQYSTLCIDDEDWLNTALGKLDIFKPLHKKDFKCGYPSIEKDAERKVSYLFSAKSDWRGPSGGEATRKQVLFFS
jgi:hypothetical protein